MNKHTDRSGSEIVRRIKATSALNGPAPNQFSRQKDYSSYESSRIGRLMNCCSVPTPPPPPTNPMILTVSVTGITPNIHHNTANDTIALPFNLVGSQTITVDYGDGTSPIVYTMSDVVDTGNGYMSLPPYTYSVNGVYTITISGTATSFGDGGNEGYLGCDLITSVQQWGNLGTDFTSLSGALDGTTNTITLPTDFPPSVTDTSFMFYLSTYNGNDISGWDVSSVTNMSGMFQSSIFNQDISGWDVRSVTLMRNLFDNSAFNQDISQWDVSSVTNMSAMFAQSLFNQDISQWDVSSVTDMTAMFNRATAFNQNLSGWRVKQVTTAANCFSGSAMNCIRWNFPHFNKIIASPPYTDCTPPNPPIPPSGSMTLSVSVSASDTIALPFNLVGSQTITVDYGDGTSPIVYTMSDVVDTGNGYMSLPPYTYSANGDYTITISGTATSFGDCGYGGYTGNNLITAVTNWGDLGTDFISLSGALDGTTNLTLLPANFPPSVTDTSFLFAGSTYNGNDISGWDVSHVTNMSFMFPGSQFNGDISRWDVSSVTDMGYMFPVSQFNGDISRWDVSSVTDMDTMFSGAQFNGDISRWDVSSVQNMGSMFNNTSAFNQDISGWDVSYVTSMDSMFSGAIAFNQDISRWDVSSVTDMAAMFSNTSAFNQDISGWDVSSVTNMSSMFNGATAFNSPIFNILPGNVVTNMSNMFYGATAFNQDISGWNVSSVTNMSNMFSGATAFNSPIFNILSGNGVTNMYGMFNDATAFNQDISGWDVSYVTSMNTMFSGASAFNQNLSGWNVSSIVDASYMFCGSGMQNSLSHFPPFNSGTIGPYAC